MADEFDLDLNEDSDEVSKAEKRIKNLSEKVKTKAEEAEANAKAKAEAEARAVAAEKERDFFKNFTPLTSKYQGAAEFQNEIWDKVKSGYSEEDATIAVLAKAGKYQPQAAPESAPVKENPAGGSAINTIKAGGEKSLEEMDRSEKKNALQDAIDKGDVRFGNL